jgi:pimeloyl-ACP methyl ester carboxylesterase
VVLLDHRGQGLSDREPGFDGTASGKANNAYVADFFQTCVGDVHALAEALKPRVVKSGGGGGKLHLVAHSMGGLIGSHAASSRPDLFDGRCVLSCPMFDTVWGDKPPGLPRGVIGAVVEAGHWCGAAMLLPPAPGAKLCWWDPHAPIEGVLLTHDVAHLKYYHALRSRVRREVVCSKGRRGIVVGSGMGLCVLLL